MKRAGDGTRASRDLLWDSEGYPIRDGDRVVLVSKGGTSVNEGTVTFVGATECRVQVDGLNAKPIGISASEIRGQHNRLLSKTAKEQVRAKNPSATTTPAPTGALRTTIVSP